MLPRLPRRCQSGRPNTPPPHPSASDCARGQLGDALGHAHEARRIDCLVGRNDDHARCPRARRLQMNSVPSMLLTNARSDWPDQRHGRRGRRRRRSNISCSASVSHIGMHVRAHPRRVTPGRLPARIALFRSCPRRGRRSAEHLAPIGANRACPLRSALACRRGPGRTRTRRGERSVAAATSVANTRLAARRKAALPAVASNGATTATVWGRCHGSPSSSFTTIGTSETRPPSRNGATGRSANRAPGLRNRFITSPAATCTRAPAISHGSRRWAYVLGTPSSRKRSHIARA